MNSRRLQIAQGVVDLLNAGSEASAFGMPFNAGVKLVPAAAMKDLTTMTITVSPIGGEKREMYDRGDVRKDLVLHIGMQKRLTTTADPQSTQYNAELDGLVQFTEQVAEYLSPINGRKPLLGTTGAKWAGSESPDPHYDPDHLRELRTFTSVLLVTYAYL